MIGQLVELALTFASAQTVANKVKRSAKEVAVKASAAAIAVVGTGFLLAALWIWLATLYTAFLASLSIGAGLILLAALVAIIGLAIVREPAAPPMQAPDFGAIAHNLAQEFDVNFSRKGAPTKTAGAALAAGFALGRMATRA